MPRFFIPPEQIDHSTFVLKGSEAHHAVTVLRKKIGDEINLFDGKDASYRGRIETVSEGELRGRILSHEAGHAVPISVTLFQALIKGPRWDWLLQKACEIGVHRVVPLTTVRTIVKDEGSASKLERWRRIAVEASKQSGRPDIMGIEPTRLFRDALVESTPEHLSLIPWEKENDQSMAKACQGFSGRLVSLYIGPEGGWDGDEIRLAESAGIIPIRLGPTLLRSETAGLVAATLVLSQLGIY